MGGCGVGGGRSRCEALLVSKNGPTELSQRVERQLDQQQPHRRWRALVEAWAVRGHSASFEWVSPEHRVVLEYPAADLILIALRDNHTGRYQSYATLAAEAACYGLTVARLLYDSAAQGPLDLAAWTAQLRATPRLEGAVLQLQHSQRWYKIKVRQRGCDGAGSHEVSCRVTGTLRNPSHICCCRRRSAHCGPRCWAGRWTTCCRA